MSMRFPWLTLALLFLLPISATAQDERMKVLATLDPKEAAVGETLKLTLSLDIQPGFHTYSTSQSDPEAKSYITRVKIKEGPLESAGAIKEPKPKLKFEKDLGATIAIFEEPVVLEASFKVKAGTAAGKHKVILALDTNVCNDSNCLPFNEKFEYEITVKASKETPPAKGNPVAPSGKEKIEEPIQKNNKPLVSSSAPVSDKNNVPEKKQSPAVAHEKNNNEPMTLSFFLGQAVFFGFVSLLTPCVFPMIPITVSYFLKQKEGGNHALIHALVYTATIIIALSIFTLFFVSFAQRLIYHWGTNLFLGLLLGFFALSLFGMFEITLPGFLTRMTSKGESKGGYLGTLFMALTFILISFSCVSPIVGTFGGVSLQERPMLWNLLGAVTFASCFAAPFFLLAIFPSMLKKLPKSGGWMNSLKVIMGMLELAAAIKFFRQSELNFKVNNPDYFTYDVVISLYVGLCLVAGLYLFKVFRMPHDHDDGKNNIGVGRFLWACLFISLGIYLFPALFRGPDGYKLRPSGEIFAWVDSFLLQGDDTKPIVLTGRGNQSVAELKWAGFLPEALADAKAKKRRIFVDFTGINCTNCTKNERAIFSQEDVKAAFSKYSLLKLYTDVVPMEYYPTDKLDATTPVEQENDGEKNRILEKERFKTTELPFYAVIEPDGNDFEIVARYSIGLIRNKEEFLQFLRNNVGK